MKLKKIHTSETSWPYPQAHIFPFFNIDLVSTKWRLSSKTRWLRNFVAIGRSELRFLPIDRETKEQNAVLNQFFEKIIVFENNGIYIHVSKKHRKSENSTCASTITIHGKEFGFPLWYSLWCVLSFIRWMLYPIINSFSSRVCRIQKSDDFCEF